jgi:hypothetical protein
MVRFQKLTRNLFLTLHGGASFLNRTRNSRCTVITDLDTSNRSTQKAFSCCDAILETGPAVRLRSELIVAHGASFLNRARNSRCTVITDLDTSKRSTQKAFSCCDTFLKTGSSVSMRSELLVAHEKLGQLPLLTVYVVPV